MNDQGVDTIHLKNTLRINMKLSFSRAAFALPFTMAMCMSLVSPTFASEGSVETDTSSSTVFKNKRDSLSYAVGVITARNLRKEGTDVNTEMVLKGMSDSLNGNRTLLSEKEMRSAMNGLMNEMRMKMRSSRKEAGDINKTAGDEFRAQFGNQPGVVKLPSGVLYKVTSQGDGQKPTVDDTVQVSYRGTLASGYEFDATPVGKSAPMKVSSMIRGLSEATRLMPTGSRWTIVIPPELAYGVSGVGVGLGPNETLIFDQELLSIKK